MESKSILSHTFLVLFIFFFSCRANDLENKIVSEAELRASTEFKELIAAITSKDSNYVLTFEDKRHERIRKLPIQESQAELAKITIEYREHKRLRLEMKASHRKRSEERKLSPKPISAADFNKITVEIERKIYESSTLPDSVKQIYIASLYKRDNKVFLIAVKMANLSNKFPSVRSESGNLILKKILLEESDKIIHY